MVFARLAPSTIGLRNKPTVIRTLGGPWWLWYLKAPWVGGDKETGLLFLWAPRVLNLLSAVGSFRGDPRDKLTF